MASLHPRSNMPASTSSGGQQLNIAILAALIPCGFLVLYAIVYFIWSLSKCFRATISYPHASDPFDPPELPVISDLESVLRIGPLLMQLPQHLNDTHPYWEKFRRMSSPRFDFPKTPSTPRTPPPCYSPPPPWCPPASHVINYMPPMTVHTAVPRRVNVVPSLMYPQSFTPQTFAWWKSADNIVGSHPGSKPLSTRVSKNTSGALIIPWIEDEASDRRRVVLKNITDTNPVIMTSKISKKSFQKSGTGLGWIAIDTQSAQASGNLKFDFIGPKKTNNRYKVQDTSNKENVNMFPVKF